MRGNVFIYGVFAGAVVCPADLPAPLEKGKKIFGESGARMGVFLCLPD
jgi:hypothetical protein